MQVKIVRSLAEPVGVFWRELQHRAMLSGEDFYVSSPLSSTPLPIYQWITEHADTFSNWDRVKFVLMDEQVEGLSPPFRYVSLYDDASYEGFARRHLLDPLDNKLGHTIPVIKPDLATIEDFKLGEPLDLLILALGVKGNYANVMPETPRSVGWHIARLIQEFRIAHTQSGSASYENAKFREFGMSLGPRQVLAAKKIVVIISGEKKRALADELFSFYGFDPSFPLSIIHDPAVSDRVTVYLTEELGDLEKMDCRVDLEVSSQ